jgi:CheY-like chemotaxis protein
MKPGPIILIVDDDAGHALLVRENLKEAGLANEIRHFKDGQAVLDFLFGRDKSEPLPERQSYLMLLDIRMPKVDGIAVLRKVKQDEELRKLPIIMLTTTDDPREVERCHQLGCNAYVHKPVNHERFVQTIQQLGGLIQFALFPPVKIQRYT